MYNFFVEGEQILNNKAHITGDDYNHIKNVLRMPVGQEILICNKTNGKMFLGKVEEISNEKIICELVEEKSSNESNLKITIYQGIPKSSKMEYIIQKSVELGAYNIVPVEMKYCVAKINNQDKKIKRWQAIAEAAAKQSKRSIIPKIENAISIKTLCTELNNFDLSLLAYENEQGTTIKDEMVKNKDVKNIAVIIGPEGGLSNEEVEMLIQNGAKSVSVGKRILRTETASSAILSMLMYEYEL